MVASIHVTDSEEQALPTCSNLLDGFRLRVERCKPVCLDEKKLALKRKLVGAVDSQILFR